MNFRVATFNTENLIPAGLRYYDRFEVEPQDYEAKANWIATILNRAKPDIVGLQEVWLEDAIQDVTRRSFHFSGGCHIAAPGATRAENLSGQQALKPKLALVSRFPITQVESFATFPDALNLTIPFRTISGKVESVPIALNSFQRPVLRAVIDVQGLDVVCYVAHLKSKGPLIAEGEDGDDPFVFAAGQARATMVRAAEAAALRHLILTDLHGRSAPTIVLGDLNDTPDAASTQIVRGPATHSKMSYGERQAIWDVVLYSTHRISTERSPSLHTHIFQGERDILDHIFVSEEFFNRNRNRIGEVVRHTTFNEHLHESTDDKSPGSSDHGLPMAEIRLLQQTNHTNA